MPYALQIVRLLAYFFHGLDGVGKRTLAIEFGKALLCTSNSTFEACGLCPSCKLVEAENHPDLQVNGCPKEEEGA